MRVHILILPFLQILVCYLWMQARGFAAETMELKYADLPALVSVGNAALKGAEDMELSAQTRTGHFARSYYPKLQFILGGERFETGHYNSRTEPYGELEATLNLFKGGRDKTEEGIRRVKVKAAAASKLKTYRTELAKTRKLYWDLVFNRETIAILNEGMEQNEKILVSANRRIKQGVATATDRLEFEIYHAELKEEIESLQHGILLLELALAPLIGQPIGTSFQTESTIPHEHMDQILKTELEPGFHPDVLAIKTNQFISHIQSGEASKWWSPSVDLYGGRHLYTFRERDYTSIENRYDMVGGIRLSLYFFAGLQHLKEARSLQLLSEAFRKQSNYSQEVIHSEFLIAKEGLRHEDELVHSSEEKIRKAKEYLNQSMAEYDRGVKNSPDILNAHQRYLFFRQQYAERRRDYQRDQAEIQKILGQ